MREILGMSELVTLIGSELGVSDWHEIEQHQVQGFADVTRDQQWIHVDPTRAAAGPFGGPVAHGYLTLSMIPFFAAQVYRVVGVKLVINYGLNRVRFPSPVPVGSMVRNRITLLAVTSTDRGTQVVVQHQTEIQESPRLACIADTVSLFIE